MEPESAERQSTEYSCFSSSSLRSSRSACTFVELISLPVTRGVLTCSGCPIQMHKLQMHKRRSPQQAGGPSTHLVVGPALVAPGARTTGGIPLFERVTLEPWAPRALRGGRRGLEGTAPTPSQPRRLITGRRCLYACPHAGACHLLEASFCLCRAAQHLPHTIFRTCCIMIAGGSDGRNTTGGSYVAPSALTKLTPRDAPKTRGGDAGCARGAGAGRSGMR